MSEDENQQLFAQAEDNDDLQEEYLDEEERSGWAQDGLGQGTTQEHQLKAFLDRLDEEHHSEDEGIQDYKLGGYHPVHIGEVLSERYVVIQKLGWGHFSTVWLARDFKYDNYVAVKIMKSAPHYIEAAYDEVEILQKVAKKVHDPEWLRSISEYEPGKKNYTRDDTHVVHMLNSFLFKGPYGNHFCMVFEILGVNLLQILKRYNYEGVPMDICKEISRQVLIGLDYLHRICKVIHTDLKPENVLVCLSDKEIKEIIDNGQLSKNELFSQRIGIYQECLGIKSPQQPARKLPQDQRQFFVKRIEAASEKVNQFEAKLEDPAVSGTHRKNLKKKKKKAEQQLAEAEAALKEAEQEYDIKEKRTLEHLIGGDGRVRFDRGPKLQVGKFSVKIADLGNACWTHHHFATEIQTRQYRSPEVLLGSMYDVSSDLWSMACMAYQMLTADLLFNPRRDQQAESYGENDDHIAQMMELLGKFPKKFSLRGVKSKKYMNPDGTLRRINRFTHWGLKDVIVGKFRIKESEAEKFANFLLPMLEPLPERRATAREMLSHPWYTQPSEAQLKMPEDEYRVIFQNLKNAEMDTQAVWYDSENEHADCEDARVDDCFDNQFFGYERKGEIRLIDRSFTDLGYIGYGEGIKLEELDTLANWQFG